MRSMNKLLATLGTALLIGSTTLADPTGSALFQSDYLVQSHDRPQWAIAFYHGAGEREVVNGFSTGQMNLTRNHFRVGYNVQPWLSLVGVIGPTEYELEGGGSGQTETEWGYGLHARLFSHDFENPQLTENQFRVDMSALWSEADGDAVWEESFYAIYLSIVNEVSGNHQFLPATTIFKLGPIWSSVEGSIGSTSFDQGSREGLAAGFEIYFNRTMSFEWEYQKYELASNYLGLRFRF